MDLKVWWPQSTATETHGRAGDEEDACRTRCGARTAEVLPDQRGRHGGPHHHEAFVTAHGGTLPQAAADLIAGIQGGQAYFNIHTPMNGGGEIRGQLSPVPEPNTVLLSATILVILGAMYLRRRKNKSLRAVEMT